MTPTRLLLAASLGVLLPGCFRLGPDDLDQALDPDGDGAISTRYGGGDCDETDPTVNPGAAEVCDGIDNDCDGQVDEGDAAPVPWWADEDADGYGDPDAEVEACDPPDGHVDNADDCDDTTALASPDGAETCDGLDNDCDGETDEEGDDLRTFYADADSDGYGDADTAVESCAAPSGFVEDDTDCDDAEAAANPGEDEVCDGIDNDCDATVDGPDALGAETWYPDRDRDGFGDAAATGTGPACDPPDDEGWADNADDCDDSTDAISPLADEACDGIDNDCDGTVDFEQNVPADHAFVQNAINAAAPGDRVCIRAGTYAERIEITDAVSLIGENRATTILEALPGETILDIRGAAAAPEVSQLTFRGGGGQQGGALYVQDASTAFEDVAFVDGGVAYSGQCFGAVMWVAGTGAPSFRGVSLTENDAACDEISGMVLVTSTGGPVTFTQLDVRENTGEINAQWTGLVHAASGAEVEITNAVFAQNFVLFGLDVTDTAADILGIAAATSASSLDLTNVTVHRNAIDAGLGAAGSGGVYVSDDSTGSLLNVTLTQNAASGLTVEATAIRGPVSERYTNVWDQAAPARTGADPVGTDGNLSVDPDFRSDSADSATDWDLQLDPTGPSPLINAGDPTLTDPDGTRSDIGAYGGPLGSWP